MFVKSPAATLDYTFDWTNWLPVGDSILTTSWSASTGITIANLPTPSGLTVSPVGSGGTFTAGSYFWKITGVSANGETTGSNEATTTLVLNGSATLNWPVQPNATHINVYRGTTTNGENHLITQLAGTAITYTDTGTTGVSQSPPGTNTATITSNTSTTATAWVTGGSAGQTYTLTGTINTAQGRIDQRTQAINVVNL